MKKVTDNTLPQFLAQSDIAVLMVGAPSGQATMDQACELTRAWLDHRDAAAFGYLDAFEEPATTRGLAIRLVPTTLVIAGGDVVARLEGAASAARIASAILGARIPSARAA